RPLVRPDRAVLRPAVAAEELGRDDGRGARRVRRRLLGDPRRRLRTAGAAATGRAAAVARAGRDGRLAGGPAGADARGAGELRPAHAAPPRPGQARPVARVLLPPRRAARPRLAGIRAP